MSPLLRSIKNMKMYKAQLIINSLVACNKTIAPYVVFEDAPISYLIKENVYCVIQSIFPNKDKDKIPN